MKNSQSYKDDIFSESDTPSSESVLIEPLSPKSYSTDKTSYNPGTPSHKDAERNDVEIQTSTPHYTDVEIKTSNPFFEKKSEALYSILSLFVFAIFIKFLIYFVSYLFNYEEVSTLYSPEGELIGF